jgi:radical SAM protein with 4Fe4S-binding SPASM domain
MENLMRTGMDQILIGIDASTKDTYEKIRIGGDFDRVSQNVNTLLRQRPDTLKVVLQFVESEDNRHEEEDFRDYWLEQGAIVKIRREVGWGGTFADRVERPTIERTPCGWLARTMTVHWNGTVVQCDGDYEGNYPVGNVTDSSLYKLWNGPLREKRERHRNHDFSFETCRHCSDWACGISEWYYPNGNGRE